MMDTRTAMISSVCTLILIKIVQPWLSHPLKISELLGDNYMTECRPAYTPGVPDTLVCTRDCPSPTDTKQLEFMRSKPYKRCIGQLLWIARSSRPDIAYQVNALARVAHNPAQEHWDASTHIIRYLSHTGHIRILYRNSKHSYRSHDVVIKESRCH